MINEKDDDVRKPMEKLHEDGEAPEQQKRLDAFIDKMAVSGPNEEAFFEERRRKGLGVGLDEDGNLVKASDCGNKKLSAHKRK